MTDERPDVVGLEERLEVTMKHRQELIDELKEKLSLLQAQQSEDRAALSRIKNRV